jgi:hypothetical protein
MKRERPVEGLEREEIDFLSRTQHLLAGRVPCSRACRFHRRSAVQLYCETRLNGRLRPLRQPSHLRLRFRALAADMNKLDRALTKDAFERDRMLEIAFEILPAEKTFAAWIGQNCDFTARTARLYRSVAAELFEYEQRAIAFTVPKTVLFELAREAVREDQIEAVLARFESGERLTVAKVKRQLAGEAGAGPDSDPMDLLHSGGIDGLGVDIDAVTIEECQAADLVPM